MTFLAPQTSIALGVDDADAKGNELTFRRFNDPIKLGLVVRERSVVVKGFDLDGVIVPVINKGIVEHFHPGCRILLGINRADLPTSRDL